MKKEVSVQPGEEEVGRELVIGEGIRGFTWSNLWINSDTFDFSSIGNSQNAL